MVFTVLSSRAGSYIVTENVLILDQPDKDVTNYLRNVQKTTKSVQMYKSTGIPNIKETKTP